MDDRFFNAIIGASDRVCGYDITALTPWHSVILSAIDSPVLNPEKDTSAGDLLLFLKVVSCEWPNMPNLKPRWRDIIWHPKLKKSSTLLKELAKLKTWLSCQRSAPELWANESEDNNTLIDSVVFTPTPPDLQVTSLILPDTVVSGQEF